VLHYTSMVENYTEQFFALVARGKVGLGPTDQYLHFWTTGASKWHHRTGRIDLYCSMPLLEAVIPVYLQIISLLQICTLSSSWLGRRIFPKKKILEKDRRKRKTKYGRKRCPGTHLSVSQTHLFLIVFYMVALICPVRCPWFVLHGNCIPSCIWSAHAN